MHDLLMWAGSVVAGLVFTLMGWVFKIVFTMIGKIESDQDDLSEALMEHKLDATKCNKDLTKSISDHKLHAAETFATKIDVDKGFDRIMNKLESMDEKNDKNIKLLNQKIDGKVDK